MKICEQLLKAQVVKTNRTRTPIIVNTSTCTEYQQIQTRQFTCLHCKSCLHCKHDLPRRHLLCHTTLRRYLFRNFGRLTYSNGILVDGLVWSERLDWSDVFPRRWFGLCYYTDNYDDRKAYEQKGSANKSQHKFEVYRQSFKI